MITKQKLQAVLDRVEVTIASWSPEKRRAMEMSTTGGCVPKFVSNHAPKWEPVNFEISRLKIKGGWIYRCLDVGIVFVPDSDIDEMKRDIYDDAMKIHGVQMFKQGLERAAQLAEECAAFHLAKEIRKLRPEGD